MKLQDLTMLLSAVFLDSNVTLHSDADLFLKTITNFYVTLLYLMGGLV